MILSITSEITAVEFRHLNSFEWAVLKILTAFPDNPPTTQEATDNLSLHEPAFIKAAIDSLSSVKAIQKNPEKEIDSDLQNFTLTNLGKEFFVDQGWEVGSPDVHTEEFSLAWPSAKIQFDRKNFSNYQKTIVQVPSNEEIKIRLDLHQIEQLLNSRSTTGSWRVKSFYISNAKPE